MNSIANFFLSLGLYNLLGVLILCLFYSERFGNTVLKDHLKIIAHSYSIGTYGALWITWSIMLNLFFAILNLLALRWGEIAQLDLLKLDLGVYIAFFLLSIYAVFSHKYAKGIWYNFLIFGCWIIWGIYLLANY